MKKTSILAALTILCFTFMAWSTCEAKQPKPPKPDTVTVHCDLGEKIADAIADAPDNKRFTVIVDGVCSECVTINRDDVTLREATPGAGDGLDGTSLSCHAVLTLRARNTDLQELTITGGHIGILATNNASFSTINLQISGANTGVFVEDNAVGILNNSSVVSFDAIGIVATRGGVTRMFGGSVDNAGAVSTGVMARNGGHVELWEAAVRNIGFHAVEAQQGGSIEITNGIVENTDFGVFAQNGNVSLRDGTIVQDCNHGGVGANEGGTFSLDGVTVQRINGHAVSGRSGARFSVGGSIIQNNLTTHDAISLGGGSTATIGGTQIINNPGNGIGIGATSVVTFFEANNTITGNSGAAIFCNNPEYGGIVGDPGTVTPNTGGGIIGCDADPPLFP